MAIIELSPKLKYQTSLSIRCFGLTALFICLGPMDNDSMAQQSSATLGPAATVLLNAPTGNPALERNKSNVLAFYDLMFNQGKPAEAMNHYGGVTYTQHNPEVDDGREAFIKFFEQQARDYPGKSASFKRVFADGDYVVLHSEHKFPGWRGGTWAAIDIFRLDSHGKIVEHWDVLQKVQSSSKNGNGMF